MHHIWNYLYEFKFYLQHVIHVDVNFYHLTGCKNGANWKGSFGHWHQGREGMLKNHLYNAHPTVLVM